MPTPAGSASHTRHGKKGSSNIQKKSKVRPMVIETSDVLRFPYRASTFTPHSIHMSYAQSPHVSLISILTMPYTHDAATALTAPTVFFFPFPSFITYGILAVTTFPLVYILDL